MPASKVTGNVSPPAPLTPMTPADEGGDELGDDDVIITQQKKKPRLHQEVSVLSERVGQAVESMNNMSKAMTDMCKEYQRESNELQEGIRAMGLQGIANKGYLATLVAFQNELKDICWQLTGSGKAQANSSMKSVGIGIGDKLVSLHQQGKELMRCTNDKHEALMDGLSAVELAIKNLAQLNAPVSVAMPSQPELPGFPMHRQAEMSGVAMPRQPEMSGVAMPRQPEMSGVAMPRQPDVGGLTAPPVGLLEVPQQPRFEVPAAFHQRKPPGYGSSSGFARRAYKVVVQGAHGQSRVRAVSPNPIRAEETPPQGWAQEYGLGNLVIGVYRHRILPDSFIADAEPYPNL